MVAYYDSIPPHLLKWIPKQHLFFVGSAPLQADGHISLSPKGYEDTFHIVNEHSVWYEDLSGSGIETVSHVRENGRITIMFVAFEGPPNIVRLYGRGSVHEFATPMYDSLLPPEKRKPGSRAVIVVDVYQVSTSCGYGVPFFKFERNRSTLNECFSAKESFDIRPSAATPERGLKAYWTTKNAHSLDGITGLEYAGKSEREFLEGNLVDTRGRFPVPGRDGGVVEPPESVHPAKTLMPWEIGSVDQNKLEEQSNGWTMCVVGFVFGLMVSKLVART